MKTKDNWLLWAFFYGTLAGILYFVWRGDEFAPTAFRAVIWFRIITTGLVCYALHAPARVLVAAPRSWRFGTAILLAESGVWYAMWQVGLVTELICTGLVLLVYEDFRRYALATNP
jgi:hypothetical protein